MKILIAYYSKTGNTEKVAFDLSAKISVDVEKIIDKKKRGGIWGYFTSGRDAMKNILTEIEPIKNDPAEYDLVVLGMPVWGWNLVPAIRTYLAINKEKIRNYAFFVTSGNTDAEKLTPHFVEIMGREPLASVGFSESELKNTEIYTKKNEAFAEAIRGLK